MINKIIRALVLLNLLNSLWKNDKMLGKPLILPLFSLSDTEHTAYTVGHPCKLYIQPNQLWPYPSYTRAIRVYPWQPCMLFKTFKKTDTGDMSVVNRISDRTRPCETVRDRTRPCETVYATAHEVHSTSGLNRVNIAYKSYGIELEQKSVGPYVNPVNVQFIE